MNDTLQQLADRMEAAAGIKQNILLGFDGFVDEVVHVVEKRIHKNKYLRVETLKEYGDKISRSAGLSTNVEMVTVQRKLGGNGPIMANSLSELGMEITYIGALGETDIHPVFAEMQKKCRVFPLCEPAHTDALEFRDGKVISSKLSALNQVSWERIEERLGKDALINLFQECQMAGFENWTMLLEMNRIWEHLNEEVFPYLTDDRRRTLFIDLADPEKRQKEDLGKALGLLKKMRESFQVILGLNKKEACELAEFFGCVITDYQCVDVERLSEYLYEKLDLDMLLVHSVKEACGRSKDCFVRVEGPYCNNPQLTTGAGDNFNAGFALGWCKGFTLEDSLLSGVANSGFYVRQARSASYQELINFIKKWSQNKDLDEK